jgi:ankyrin repeat protein
MPAGYEDSDDENIDGYFIEHSYKNSAPPKKSEIEIFKENLMSHLRNNSVGELRNELDKGVTGGFDIDSGISGGWSLLFHACYTSVPDVVQFLVEERNVDVCALNDEGESCLMISCTPGEGVTTSTFDIVKMLTEKDPRLVSKRNSKGETALMIAAKNGHLAVVEYLISLGDSLDNVSNFGRNALFYAIEGKQVHVAEKLFEHRIDYTVEDCYGDSAKSFAEINQVIEILELFPPEEYVYETPSAYMSYGNFEALIPNVLPLPCANVDGTMGMFV